MTTITAKCMVCRKTDTIDVPTARVKEWQAGALVQSVFPELLAAEREILVGSRSGAYMCDACWGEED